MSKTRTAGIPSLPARTPRELRPFLEAIRENVQVSLGQRGKSLDRAVTFRDLSEGNIANVSVSGNSVSLAPPSDDSGSDNYPVPDAPTGFQAVTGFTFALLSWDVPSYAGHSVAEIYRANADPESETPPVIGDAVLVGTTSGFLFNDPLTPPASVYYWIRFINQDGDIGPWHSTDGLFVETAQSYDQVIEDSIQDILDAVAVWQGQQETAQSIIDDSVVQNALANATQYTALVERISAVEGTLGSSITTTQETAANNNETVALQVNELKSLIYQTDNNGNILYDTDGVTPLFVGGFVTNVDNTYANLENSQFIARIGTDLSVTYVDTEGTTRSATLSEIASVSYTADDGLVSQWGVKQTYNDIQYGVGFVGTEENRSFVVAVDTFVVYNPANGEEMFPFVIDEEGNTLINTAYIKAANITDLVAGDIVADTVAAGSTLTSPIIESGEILSSKIEAIAGSYSFRVDPDSSIPVYFGDNTPSVSLDNSTMALTDQGEMHLRKVTVWNNNRTQKILHVDENGAFLANAFGDVTEKRLVGLSVNVPTAADNSAEKSFNPAGFFYQSPTPRRVYQLFTVDTRPGNNPNSTARTVVVNPFSILIQNQDGERNLRVRATLYRTRDAVETVVDEQQFHYFTKSDISQNFVTTRALSYAQENDYLDTYEVRVTVEVTANWKNSPSNDGAVYWRPMDDKVMVETFLTPDGHIDLISGT